MDCSKKCSLYAKWLVIGTFFAHHEMFNHLQAISSVKGSAFENRLEMEARICKKYFPKSARVNVKND
jgi:hypothetical protein